MRPFYGCNDLLLPILVWKALVLTQKNTKLTQSINRSPLGQKIPDLLLEQLKTTKPATKNIRVRKKVIKNLSIMIPWSFRKSIVSGERLLANLNIFDLNISLEKIILVFFTLSKGPQCVPCRTHGYYCLDSPSRLSRPNGLLDFLYCIPMPCKCFISSNLNS